MTVTSFSSFHLLLLLDLRLEVVHPAHEELQELAGPAQARPRRPRQHRSCRRRPRNRNRIAQGRRRCAVIPRPAHGQERPISDPQSRLACGRPRHQPRPRPQRGGRKGGRGFPGQAAQQVQDTWSARADRGHAAQSEEQRTHAR